MHDVISTITRSERLTLATSLAVLAVAGAANASVAAGIERAAAVVLAVGGVYGLARYAQGVTRKRLALLSIGLWSTFLAVAGLHAVGLEAIAVVAPGAAILEPLVWALTWATLLGACASTTFLGFREYGAPQGIDSPEDQVIESEYDC